MGVIEDVADLAQAQIQQHLQEVVLATPRPLDLEEERNSVCRDVGANSSRMAPVPLCLLPSTTPPCRLMLQSLAGQNSNRPGPYLPPTMSSLTPPSIVTHRKEE